MENKAYASKEEDFGSELLEAARVEVWAATDSMDLETLEILVEDKFSTGG